MRSIAGLLTLIACTFARLQSPHAHEAVLRRRAIRSGKTASRPLLPALPASSKSSTPSSSGLSNPSNLASGSVTVAQGCKEFSATVEPGDYCSQIVSQYNIPSLSTFYLLNPSVDADCSNLIAGLAYCVSGSVAGSSTSNTAANPASQPVALASPTATSSASTTDGPFTGDATWFQAGLGACGSTVNGSVDKIVAASHALYDSYGGGYASSGNPNLAPICGKKIRATYGSKSVDVVVQDRCEGCALYDLDFSQVAFEALAPLGVGRMVITVRLSLPCLLDERLSNKQWEWI